MQVIEAQRASILEPHDHLHISHERTFRAHADCCLVFCARGGLAGLTRERVQGLAG
jgi:hypothetical protein